MDDTAKLDEAIIARLRDVGLPIARYVSAVPSLHPHIDGLSAHWRDDAEIRFIEHFSDAVSDEVLARSPIVAVIQSGQPYRRRLTTPPPDDGGILGELYADGYTDYLIIALPFADGSHKAISFAARGDGFSDEDAAMLHALAAPIAATMEVRYLAHLTGVLMDTYVGTVAGRKVLDGAIKRGSSETIRAAIWLCDLKGFTALSENLRGEELLALLNQYFEAMTTAIEAHQGEVLKFIGDAVLAIFQPGGAAGGGGEQPAAERALCATRDAIDALDEVNRMRISQQQTRIDCGIALHFGDVLYGNVGGQRRLDFTVIGPAVNLAARIESLTRELNRTVLVSKAFAEVHRGKFETLGAFSFKGIADGQTVLAPL